MMTDTSVAAPPSKAAHAAPAQFGATEEPAAEATSLRSPLKWALDRLALMGIAATLIYKGTRKGFGRTLRAALSTKTAAASSPLVVSRQGPPVERALALVLKEPLSHDAREDCAAVLEVAGDLDRAKFIRLQLKYFARESLPRHLRREMDKLLLVHGAEWAGEVAPLVSYYRFSRGFVELVGITAAAFLKHAPRLLKAAPILHLELSGEAGEAGKLLSSPYLGEIRSLSLDGWGLGDDEAKVLAESPHLGKLAWLSLANNTIGREGVEALANSSRLPALQFVNLSGNPCDPGERYAHDDGRIVESWRPDEASSLAVSRRVPWLERTVTGQGLLPDRFVLAQAEVAAYKPAYAVC